MTGSSDERGQLDISLLREISKESLISHLISINGAKTLIIDPNLSNQLSLLTEISLLKDHGIARIFWLENTPPSSPNKALLYLLRPTIENIKLVASHVKAHQKLKEKETYSYKLLFSPRESALTNAILESEGVRGSVECASWDMGFIPLEPDLISLERDSVFRELWVVSSSSL